MKRGTVVLTKFPFTDLRASKRRPAVVVSRETNISDFIVAFISSVIPANLSDTDFLLEENHKDFERSGLLKNSVIKLDKLATLNKSIFTGELGFFSADTIKEIDKRLKIALNLK